ncbi:serine hydrolase domain-containing protein [Hymenobacter sp. H14-R3]|uniref:serine hydrolase domain-containing protein n=1 Tax=Hymenobacter sp. H14-R3 TaxID=3046308 RepID=UPI0024BB8417|nr:serine hydrolase domain-containing protein [Hymenobacter sp. H14-R3]MDJ0366210.1 serine hydrolase domain-containing protein [Hymenobacter sp. H14-R3]
MRIPFLLLLTLLSQTALAQRAAELTTLLKRHGVPGMQVVYTKGKTVEAYNLGVREAGTKQPVTATTTFEAASLGKEMLAYVALRLLDRHLLDLDKPLLQYAAYPRLQGQPRAARITARMALAHTAGLPNWSENPTGPGWQASALALKYAPDSCWNYSGEGYTFLQKTLEHITGKPLETLATEEIFKPLGLKNSSFKWRESFATTASAGHDSVGKPAPIDHFTEPNAGFSLYSTATDYSRFLQALRTGEGLQPATALLLRTAATPANPCGQPATATDPYIDWACGVGLATTSRGLAQWQWGDNGNFKGFFMTLPGQQESLLIFTNSANGPKLVEEVLTLFFGAGEYRATQWLRE